MIQNHFISIFILLTCRKATEALIHRASNYKTCFQRCQDIAICLKFNKNMTLNRNLIKFRIACQDYQAGESAVKCRSQGHNRMVQVEFEPRPCRSQSRRSNHSTTLLTTADNEKFWLNEKNCCNR